MPTVICVSLVRHGAASGRTTSSPTGPGVPATDERLRNFVERATCCGTASSGHHNQNYVLALNELEARLLGREPCTSVTVRIRRAEALPVVIRTWDNEDEILGAVKDALPHVPQCLAKGPDFAVHSYVEGVPLSSICANGKPVDTLLVRALAGLLAQMTRVRRSFATAAAALAEQRHRQPGVPAHSCPPRG